MVDEKDREGNRSGDARTRLGEDVTPEERAAYEFITGMSDEEYLKRSEKRFYERTRNEILSEIP